MIKGRSADSVRTVNGREDPYEDETVCRQYVPRYLSDLSKTVNVKLVS